MSDGPQDGEESSIWDRLRRRKVVQWGVAYAAGAWGLLQGLQFLAEAFEWPSRVLKLGTVAAMLGLPVALALAWFRGERGAQRVTRAELAVVTLLFLVGGGLFWHYHRTSATQEPQVAAQSAPPSVAAPAALPTDRSIAVLPFVNMSADKEQEYFADGISEELLNLLAKVPELRVIARTSSFAFKGKEADIAEIARKLNVAHVLEGSVRKSGDKLRITAQLIRASDSSHLWSDTYDRQLNDVFAIQDEIAAAVVDQLKIKLLGTSPTARSTSPEVYELFLQARQIRRQYTTGALEQSVALYRQAVSLDPKFAVAWAGLAGALCDQFLEGLQAADDSIAPARDAIATALSLDPRHAPAHSQLAVIAIYYDRDLTAAARHLEHALELDPANPDIVGVAAVLARRLGRFDQAIRLGTFVTSRDPLHADGHFNLGLAYLYAGRLDEAMTEFRSARALSPGFLGAYAMIAESLLLKGDAHGSLATAQQEVDEAWRLIELSMVHHALGDATESDAALAAMTGKYGSKSAYVTSIAGVLAYRGEVDGAFEWLDKAAQKNDPTLGIVPFDALFRSLHSDPRWLPFLRKHNMAPEQLAAIKFDVKFPE